MKLVQDALEQMRRRADIDLGLWTVHLLRKEEIGDLMRVKHKLH